MKAGTVVYQGLSKTGKEIIIRYPTGVDTQVMMDFINVLSLEETYIAFQGEQVTFEEEKKYVEECLKQIEEHKGVKLIALSGGKMVGSSDVTVSGKKVDGHVGTFGITLAKEYRGEGIGTILMDTVLKESIKEIEGLRIIILGVFSNNERAKHMYEKFGFKEYGNLPKGIAHRGEYVDHIFMYRNVEK